MSKRRFGAAMHAADAAGREDADAGQVGADHGGGDRGGAMFPRRDGPGEIVAAEFQHVRRRSPAIRVLIRRKADADRAVDHRDGGGHGALPGGSRSSTASAVATFRGYGMPCATMVDSSATTAAPAVRASRTAGADLQKFLRSRHAASA